MARTKQLKRLPDMSKWSDEKVAKFWEEHDSTEYLDEVKEVDIEVGTLGDYRVISLRLGESDIKRAKQVASKKGIPYTILLRMWIKEKLQEFEVRMD